jgi:acid phosphatase type 7
MYLLTCHTPLARCLTGEKMRRLGWLSLVFILWLACGRITNGLQAAQLVRGPYLQAQTSDSIIIRWRTDVPTESVVNFGTHSSDFPVAFDPTLTNEHIVQLSGLAPATRYFYSVGSMTELLAQGPSCRFVTAPTAGQSASTRIWALGDSGGLSFGETNVIPMRDAYFSFTQTRRSDVWLLLGDNAYEDGTDEEYQVNFFDVFSSLLRQLPPSPAIGNHETYSANGTGWFPYLGVFSTPTNGQCGGIPSGSKRYYSFNYGNIHFVSLDAMAQSRTPDGPMATWLRADLDANTNLWFIAFWHHPPYSKGSHDSDTEIELIEMRQYIVPILEAHGVDVVLCGHSHNYERSFLLHGHYGFSTNLSSSMILDAGSGRQGDTGAYVKVNSGPQANKGTVYVVAGSAGDIEPRFGHHPAMFTDAASIGSVVIDINTNRLDARFVLATGQIADSFTIIKGGPPPLQFSNFLIQNMNVVARWRSVPGMAYQVERTDNFVTPVWQPVGTPVVATGATTCWTNPVTPGAPLGYFRLSQEVP